ncbi:hypothetical protein ACJ41O_010416 [Fusarium nematophilum]
MEPPYTQSTGVPLQRRPVQSFFNPAGHQNLKSIIPFKKNELRIEINDHFASKRYRPGSTVQGNVTIKPRKRIQFGSVSIKFVCESSVEKLDSHLSLETWHRLLDLDMPIPRDALPEPKILLPDQTYTIPFYFVLPESLGTAACAHRVDSEETKYLHCQLPPSITGWDRDAMIPGSVRIEYGIIAQVLDSGTPQYAKLESKQTIQFLPGFLEHPPLTIAIGNRTYQLKSSKQLKKNLLSRATGQIALSADQPKALVLDASGFGFHAAVVVAHLQLESFDGKPSLPQDCSVSAKLESETWSHDEPMEQCPHLIDRRDSYSNVETILKKMDTELVWEEDALDKAGQSGASFRSRLEIPLRDFVSDKRVFLPTFYSCLVARSYQLQVIVHVAGVALKLVLPVQLSMEEIPEAQHLDIALDSRGSGHSGLLPSYAESERRESETSMRS